MIDTGVGQFGGGNNIPTSHPSVEDLKKVRNEFEEDFLHYNKKSLNKPNVNEAGVIRNRVDGSIHQLIPENAPTRYLERIHLDLNNKIDDVYTMENILNKLLTYLSGVDDFIVDPDFRQMEFKSVSEAIDSKLRLLCNKNGDVLTKLKQLEELL